MLEQVAMNKVLQEVMNKVQEVIKLEQAVIMIKEHQAQMIPLEVISHLTTTLLILIFLFQQLLNLKTQLQTQLTIHIRQAQKRH
jgi:hypothetical protein